MKPDQKFFVFDVESVGLHGQGFAVGGGIYDINGRAVEGSEFVFTCGPTSADSCKDWNQSFQDREWVADNVTVLEGAVLCANPGEVRTKFWHLWEMAKAGFPGILMFVECGWPVEARFLIECVEDEPGARNWGGPYPMHEIATLMLAAGMDPMATYDRQPEEQPAHEPLADARLSARLLSEALARISASKEALRLSRRFLEFFDEQIDMTVSVKRNETDEVLHEVSLEDALALVVKASK